MSATAPPGAARARDLLVFSHANSFPASTYRVMFDALAARGFDVRAPMRFGHDPAYPVTDNWPHLVRELRDFAVRQTDRVGEPVWLVGHSLGGFLSLLCASAHPEIARGVVLLDAPLIAGWRAAALGAAKRTKLAARVSPGAVSMRRRERWPSIDAARSHFANKKAFAAWDAGMLEDYVVHGTRAEDDGARALYFERSVETAIYNTLPDHVDRLLVRQPLRAPVAFIGGTRSVELRRVGLDLTRRVTEGRIAMVEGTHLFPMERPLVTAAQVEASVLGLRSAAVGRLAVT